MAPHTKERLEPRRLDEAREEPLLGPLHRVRTSGYFGLLGSRTARG